MGKLNSLLKSFGFDFGRTLRALRALPKFYADYRAFSAATKGSTFDFPIARFYPMLNDNTENSGVATGHYFHQDIYVARRIFEAKPKRHVDVASRVDGFVAHVAVFREIEVADIRPLTTTARNITFRQCNIMDPKSRNALGTADSVSCLHSIEHFGLGRYGDPIQVDGHIAGLKNLAAIVAPGGILYVSVPIGPQRVEFNGHRVFAVKTLPSILAQEFLLERFSLIDDAGNLSENLQVSTREAEAHFGCKFGCGIYEFRRVVAKSL